MLELLRKHQHGIMIVVAFIVIIAFAWFFNPYDTRSGSLGGTTAFSLGKKSVSLKEVERQQRILQVGTKLGFSFTMQLLQPTFDVVDFTQNRLLLRQEARKLGIEPTDEDVLRAIGNHPSFQTSGKFDQSRYDDAIANELQPAGLQPGDLRNLVADKITLEKVDALLGSNASVPSSLVDLQFQRDHEKISASVIDFNLADFEAEVEVTDEKLKAFYDEQRLLLPAEEEQLADQSELNEGEKRAIENLLSKEKREVEFVFFEQPMAPTPPAGIPSIPGLDGAQPFPGASGVQSFEIPNPSAGNTTTPPTINLNPSGANPGGVATPPVDLPQIDIPELDIPEIEVPAADPEAEPPGQAPSEPLEGSTELETEPLPAPPVGDLDELDVDLTPLDELQSDVTVGGLTEDVPPPAIPGDGSSLTSPNNPLTEQPAPMLDGTPSATPSDAATSASIDADDHQQKMIEYTKRVDDFYTSLLKTVDQFQALAEKEGLELKKSGLFTQDDPPASPRMPTELITAIFKAQADIDDGVMVPVEALNPQGFYVVRITKAEKPRELTFEEAKPTITKAFTKKEAEAKMKEAAEAAREKLSTALASGTSFADAAKAEGLTVRDIAEFTLTKRPTGEANATELVDAVRATTTGAISEVTQAGDNVMLVSVTQRVAAPEVKPEAPAVPTSPGQDPAVDLDPEAEKTKLAERLSQQARRSIFGLWLSNRREAVGVSRNPQIRPIIYFPYGNSNFGF